MNEYIPHIPAKFIVPFNVNGMNGRMLFLPAPKTKKRDIFVVYGHHSSLERMYGVVKLLHKYGSVTMPDLPGFGGMDSFYRIGQKPSLDNLADYLATIIKLRYKNRRITIVGYSFGFLVATRMLQKYPGIAKRTDLLISAFGFAHRDDLTFSKFRHNFYKLLAVTFSGRLTSKIFKAVALNQHILRTFYSRTHNAKHKFGGLGKNKKIAMTEFEVVLWRINEPRTYMYTSRELLSVDNCGHQVDLPVWNLCVKNDNYFDNHFVEQHMRVIFSDYHSVPLKLKKHSMNIIAGKKETAVFLPPRIRTQLNKKAPQRLY